MTRSARLAVSAGLLLLSCLWPPALPFAHSEGVAVTSLIRLIATPEAFDGKRVRVGGYCHLGFESDALYLHREDYAFLLSVNAVILDLGDRDRRTLGDRSGRYVIVQGTFVMRDARDPRPYGGTLKVEAIEALQPRAAR